MGDSIEKIDNASGAPSPNTELHPRYAPAADEMAQGGEQHLAGRKPVEIDGTTGESFGRRMEDVPGLPAEIFGGTGVIRHDPGHGGAKRRLRHRQAVEIDGNTGEELREIPDHELRAHMPDLRTSAHLAAAAGDPFASNLMGPAIGPDTHVYRRVPGSDGYRVPSMYDRDRDAEIRGRQGRERNRG